MQIAGKNASVKHGGTAGTSIDELSNWTIDVSIDTTDVTAFGDEWRDRLAGIGEWTATAEGSWDAKTAASKQIDIQNAILNKTAFELACYADGSVYYSGTVFCTNLSVDAPVEDKVGVSYDFENKGALEFGTV